MNGRLFIVFAAATTAAALVGFISVSNSFAQQGPIVYGLGELDKDQPKLMDPTNLDNVTSSSSQQPMMPASANKTLYVFSEEVEGFDEATTGIPGDIFSLPVIVANQGDNITVNLYNTESELGDRHSFTIDAPPYSTNIDVGAGEGGNATFTADEQGIFPFYCMYHLPTMQGQLVVLPPIDQNSSPVSTNATLSAKVDEQFNITLDSNPTTGYEWQLALLSNPEVVEFVGSEYITPESQLLGSGGKQVLTFNALQEGSAIVKLEYVRPWEIGVPPVSTYFAEVTVDVGLENTAATDNAVAIAREFILSKLPDLGMAINSELDLHTDMVVELTESEFYVEFSILDTNGQSHDGHIEITNGEVTIAVLDGQSIL